jgi:hypothetical protein
MTASLTSTTSSQTSAKIIPFPGGGRKSVGLRGNATPADLTMPTVAFGSGWYHDAAIQESKRVHEH